MLLITSITITISASPSPLSSPPLPSSSPSLCELALIRVYYVPCTELQGKYIYQLIYSPHLLSKVKIGTTITPLVRGGRWTPKRLGSLPSITELVSGRDLIWIWGVWIQGLNSYPLSYTASQSDLQRQVHEGQNVLGREFDLKKSFSGGAF